MGWVFQVRGICMVEERLDRAFFSGETAAVARRLIGATIARHVGRGEVLRARIVETEAYVSGDPANHATRGPSRKNWSMFTGPGHLYVYQIHQVHCTNITTVPGEAVLLRAAVPLTAGMLPISGPGLLSRHLHITRADDGLDVADDNEIWLNPATPASREIAAGPRVGIREWTKAPLRFRELQAGVASVRLARSA